MALVSWPPTSARFLASCPKPEAFAEIAVGTIDQVLSSRATRSVQIALSDRDGIDVTAVVLQMDDGFEGIVFRLTGRDLMAVRGYNRDAGADDEIVALANEAREDLLMMAPGAAGKRVTPQYVLSEQRARQDSIRVNSQDRPDNWARGTSDPRKGRGFGTTRWPP